MFAVVVTFTIKSGQMAQFMPLIRQNARQSLAKEKGCHQFDVATDPARENEVFLYELYTDAAAFDVHRAASHFATFNAQAGDMIADKDVRTFSEVQQ